MTGKDSRAKRRKQLFVSATRTQKTNFQLREFLGNQPPGGNSFDSPHLWDTFARNALRLNGNDFISEALRAAFDEFSLDPADPYSWRMLASFFACVEFGKLPRARVGAPRKWDDERLAKLRAQIAQMRAADDRITDTEIARRLALDPHFGTKGTDADAGRAGLRKAIGKTRRV